MVIPVAFHAGMLPYFMFFFLLLLLERAERVNTKWGNNKYGGRFNLCLTFVVRWAGHTPEWTNSLFFGSAPVALCCFRERKKNHFDLQLDTKPWSISPCAGHGHPAWRISRLRTLSLLLFYLIEILISFCPTISLASLDDVSWKCTYGKLLNWWKSRIEYIVPSSLWSRYR